MSDFNCFQETCINANLYQSDLVVEAFPLVLCASAKDFLVQEFQLKVSASLPINLLAEMWIRLLCHKRSPCFCSTATVLFTQSCEKKVSIVSPSAQKYKDNCPPHLLLSVPRDNGLVARKTWCPLSPNLIVIKTRLYPILLLVFHCK